MSKKPPQTAPMSLEQVIITLRFAQERHEHCLKQNGTDFDIQERGT
jgi:hypothetical protein